MTPPTLVGGLLLGWLLVVLPHGAIRSAKALRQADTEPIAPRSQILLQTNAVLLLTLLGAWAVARQFGWSLFSVPVFGVRELALGVAALGLMLALRQVSLQMRTAEERRTMPIRHLLPRTTQEHAIYAGTAVMAGVAEEAAYRGALVWVLVGIFGSPPLAIALSVVACALAHLVQGWKSVWIIAVIALLMHALVLLTGTLVVAMVVHASYDLIAGVLGMRELSTEAVGST